MRKGVELGFMIKLVLWAAVLFLVFLFIRKYIVGAGGGILTPADGLLG